MKVFSCNHAKHPDDYHICLNHWEFVGTLVDSSGSWIEKHKVRTSVWLKNVPHWWATVTSKCLYKVGVTSKGVPLGYPLLRTGERLEKHIYHLRDDDDAAGRAGLGLGVGYLSIDFIIAKTNTHVWCWIQCSNILARFSVSCLYGLVFASFIFLRKPRLISC